MDRPTQHAEFPQDATERPAKRGRTKGRAACLACRARRSKCDLVDALGCHRCKQLKTECSFRLAQSDAHCLPGSEPMPSESRSVPLVTLKQPPASTVLAVEPGTISNLERRVIDMEKEIQSLRQKWSAVERSAALLSPRPPFDFSVSSGPTNPGQSPADPLLVSPEPSSTRGTERAKSRNKEPDRDEAWFQTWADPERFSLIHRGVQGKEERGLRDPIIEGIITESQAEMMYQMFKFQFVSVFPHPTLLNVESSFPTHPFLLSACLYYVIRCDISVAVFTPEQIRHIETFLFQNLNAYHRGCRPSNEGILASFILSFLPVSILTTEGSELDPMRMVGLAYSQIREMGQSVYLDRLVNFVDSGVPIGHLEKQLNDARMFMGVINRSAWFAHNRCPWAALPVLIEDSHKRILAYLTARGLDCALDRHLVVEHRLLEILHGHSHAWQILQRCIAPSADDIVRGNGLVTSSHGQLSDLLLFLESLPDFRSLAYLRCHIIYCKWWVSVRNVWSIYRLPSPLLVDAAYDAWTVAMSHAALAASDLIASCLQERWALGRLPAAVSNAIILCFAALSTGLSHFKRHYPARILPQCLECEADLSEIETYAAQESAAVATLLTQTRLKLAEYEAQLANQRAIDPPEEAWLQPQLPGLSEFSASMQFDMGAIAGQPHVGPFHGNEVLAGMESWWNWTYSDFEDLTGLSVNAGQ